MNIERERLLANVLGPEGWKHWGPYLSERQWGTVREDYSPGGTAWEYFPHEHARSRAYRWGEDGIGGVCDAEQLVCLSLALWNGARSDFEGAHVRPHQRRRQSWRGRQRALLLSGRDSHALLLEDALQISAPGISVCGSGRGECAARHRRAGIRVVGHRHLCRESLLRRVHRVRASRARRCPHESHGLEPRPERPAACAAAIGVAQHLELGLGLRQAASESRRSRRHRGGAGGARREPLVFRRQRRGALHRKRNQCAAPVERGRGGLFQGWLSRSHRRMA